jgi:hypothetical protein
MDSGRAPLRVFLAHPLNEIAQATINFRPPCPLSGFPAPESFEAYAMPSQYCLRLNHLGRAKQARPEPCHPYQQCTVNPAQSKTRRRMPQCDVDLMTEKQVLGLKSAPRLEQVGDEHSERVQDCKHRHQRCDDSILLCESRPDGIFGKETTTRRSQPQQKTAGSRPLHLDQRLWQLSGLRGGGRSRIRTRLHSQIPC